VFDPKHASEINIMQAGDMNEVVSVHLASFQGFFLTFLGPRFLRELYAGIIADPTGITFVYRKENHILGFVAGTSQPASFYRRLLHRRMLRFVWVSLIPILKRPAIIPRLLRAYDMPRQAEYGEQCGTLMSLAVAPQAQGMGIGKNLVQAFLNEAACRGLAEINLLTDRLNNESTNQFYLRYGFRLFRSYTTFEGREMNEYRIDIPEGI
jgi:ribosomal protein S18 acetylase RimI-like enzyme